MSATAGLEFDYLFRRYRRDAVLLHRPYPPHAGPRTNSWIGGLPGLPAHLEWPRASDGTPLHFYAQVDCADIAFRTPLPDRGVLFFFGRDFFFGGDDDEYIRTIDPLAAPDYRVLYALDATAATPRREAPDGLPPTDGSFLCDLGAGFSHEGGRGPTLLDEWPLRPLPMTSWPDVLPDAPDSRLLGLHAYVRASVRARPPSYRMGAVWARWRAGIRRLVAGPDPDPEESWKEAEARELRYKEELERLRRDAFTQATGERPVIYRDVTTLDWKAGKSIFLHAEQGPQAYPQFWGTVRFCALALLGKGSSIGPDPAMRAQLAPAAEEWLRRAYQAGLDEAVPEEDRRAFRSWLTSMRRPTDEVPLSFRAAELVLVSTYATVRSWAGDPARAARLPPAVYEALRYKFDPFSWRVEFWQMLGHAPSPQRPLPPNDPTVCLLANPGGFYKFWIDPEALARLEFSKVEGMREWD